MADTEFDVGPAAELAEGAMRAAAVGGRKLLLARVNGVCHAIGNICPHAGGPLDEGALDGEVVLCPWHKAAFRITTGKRVEPPAVDDVPSYPVRIADGRLLVAIGEAAHSVDPGLATQAVDSRCIVLAGAGAAGAAAAQTLREEGFAGRVVMISSEDRLPYDRTVLSKYAISGETGGEKSPLQDAAFYVRNRIERRAQTIASIDADTRTVGFADGSSLAYDAALLATGGQPRPLNIPGNDLDGVFTLRSAADVEALVVAARRARRVVVAGSGFIGMEAAASLRERGLDVTVVAPERAPFERTLGTQIGQVFRRAHERRGIAFRLGDEVVAIEGEAHVTSVRLRDGAVLPAELVLAGLGISPSTDMLRNVVLRKDGGIDVDPFLHVSNGLYAAGDVAAFPLRGDGERIRVEHWRVAQQHGRVAALNMLGRPTRYDAVPYFWTIHFRKRLDYIGHAGTWDELVVAGDLDTPEFVAFYVAGGRVAAVAGWDRDPEMAKALGLMTERRDWTVAELRQALGV